MPYLRKTTLSQVARAHAYALLLLLIAGWTWQPVFSQHTIDFESAEAGESAALVVSNQGYGGIAVFGEHIQCPLSNAAVIYDTSCPGGCSGGDPDLGTPNESFGGPGKGIGGEAGSNFPNDVPLGNVLIVHAACNDLNSFPVSEPRDWDRRHKIFVRFPTSVTLHQFTIIDIELGEEADVTLLDDDGNTLSSINLPSTGDNGVAQVEAGDVAGVREIMIVRSGSGAIDNISFSPVVADLRISNQVDDPTPDEGDNVTFTLVTTNDGPDDATGVTVKNHLPAGLGYVSHTGGSLSIDGEYSTWTIGDLAVGDSTTLTITAAINTDEGREDVAQVQTSDQWDPDSSPGNDVMEEDDQDAAAVTPGESSGGGSGGLESAGNMATKVARRLFMRREDAQVAAALHAAPTPVPLATAMMGNRLNSVGAEDELAPLMPLEGPEATQAYIVSPTDLLGITNATGVMAVDYQQVSGKRLAAIFSAVTPSGELYDHTKATCDRFGGGTMDDVRVVYVKNEPFLLTKLRHADGATDYAINLVAYKQGNTYTVDSRFASREYIAPTGTDLVLNFQIWGVTPDHAQSLLHNVLNRLEAQGDVTYATDARNAPSVFVMSGSYEQGVLTLRLKNRAGETYVDIHGSLAMSEQDADDGLRQPFKERIAIPPTTDDHPFVEVHLTVGPIFDAQFTVEHEASSSIDQIYHADGAWSYASSEQSSVTSFETFGFPQSFVDHRYVIERGGTLAGEVESWASLFRYLRPNGQPVDLSAYSHLTFTAYGEGNVRMVVEKASIDNWDQFGYDFSLTTEPQTYTIPFDELQRVHGGGEPFSADDIRLLAFYVQGTEEEKKPFTIHLEHVGFFNKADDRIQDQPFEAVLEQNYPNPFNPSTNIAFTLNEASHVRLTVYDLLGRKIAILADGIMPAGRSVVTFDAGALPSGLYLYRLQTPKQIVSQTMSFFK